MSLVSWTLFNLYLLFSTSITSLDLILHRSLNTVSHQSTPLHDLTPPSPLFHYFSYDLVLLRRWGSRWHVVPQPVVRTSDLSDPDHYILTLGVSTTTSVVTGTTVFISSPTLGTSALTRSLLFRRVLSGTDPFQTYTTRLPPFSHPTVRHVSPLPRLNEETEFCRILGKSSCLETVGHWWDGWGKGFVGGDVRGDGGRN